MTDKARLMFRREMLLDFEKTKATILDYRILSGYLLEEAVKKLNEKIDECKRIIKELEK